MSAAALGAVYQLGLLLLMFAAGAEMRKLLQRNAVRTVGLIAGFGMVLPFAAGLGLVAALGTNEFIGPARNHAALVLVFGLAIAVTSIPVISRIMHDLGLLSTRFARIVLSVAVIEDIVLYVIWPSRLAWCRPASTAFGSCRLESSHDRAEQRLPHGRSRDLPWRWRSASAAGPTRCWPGCAPTSWPAAARSPSSCFGCSRYRRPRWCSAWSRSTGRSPPGSAVAVADDGLAVRQDRNALTGISFGFFIPVYFALIGLQLDLIHHFNPLFFVGFLVFALRR